MKGKNKLIILIAVVFITVLAIVLLIPKESFINRESNNKVISGKDNQNLEDKYDTVEILNENIINPDEKSEKFANGEDVNEELNGSLISDYIISLDKQYFDIQQNESIVKIVKDIENKKENSFYYHNGYTYIQISNKTNHVVNYVLDPVKEEDDSITISYDVIIGNETEELTDSYLIFRLPTSKEIRFVKNGGDNLE